MSAVNFVSYFIPKEPGREDVNTLLDALAQGDLPTFRSLLEQGGWDLNRSFRGGASLLMIAAGEGQLDIVKYLVEKDSTQVHKVVDGGETALFMAAQEGHLSIVAYLLEQGADINQPLLCGTTPLFMAVQKRRVSIVKYLLEKGANPNQCRVNGTSPTYMAVQLDDSDILQLLIEEGKVDLSLPNGGGMTLLFLAADFGHLECVRFLLKQPGIKIDQGAEDNWTPLMIAAHRKYLSVCQLLAAYGADLDGLQIDLYDASIQKWLNRVRSQDRAHWPLLHQACLIEDIERIKELLRRGHDERALAYDSVVGEEISADRLCQNEDAKNILAYARLPYDKALRRLPEEPLYPRRTYDWARQLLLVQRRLVHLPHGGPLPKRSAFAFIPQSVLWHIIGLAIHRSDFYEEEKEHRIVPLFVGGSAESKGRRVL